MSGGTDITGAIFGATGAGFRLSLILNALSCELANAPAEVHAISKSVTLFSLLLKQTATSFEDIDSVHSRDAVRTAEQVLSESNAIFGEINSMLDRVRTSGQDGTISPSVTQRLQWCFKKHAIEYLLARMDRLQMSLSLMLQIMQLGTTMASTSRRDSPDRVAAMSDRIRRERVEAQNVVVLYFFENQKVDQLYITAREEESVIEMTERRRSDASDALTLVQSQDSEHHKLDELAVLSHDTTIKAPARVLPEFEDSWRHMDRSPEDMFKTSNEVITKLLDRWTIWRVRRDQELQQPRKTSRYRAAVHDEYDDDDILPSARDVDHDDNPAGRYLEGITTDWRQPHSVEAMQRRTQLRKAYAGYQPSVEGGSDKEDSPGSRGSSKKASRTHVINSDTSSDEDVKPRPRRRSSAIAVPSQQQPNKPEEISKSYTANTSRTPSQRQTRPHISPQYSQYPPPGLQRPFVTPDQSNLHHSFSTPSPTQYTHHPPVSPNQFVPPSMQSYPFPPPQASTSRYVPRLTPQPSRTGQSARPTSRDGPIRPVSRDGRPARSPSRLSREYTTADYKDYELERKKMKKELKKDIGDKAAKSLLAGGGLAVLLEALDAFS